MRKLCAFAPILALLAFLLAGKMVFAQSYTDWNRDNHSYQIKNSHGESEVLNIDNGINVYLPLIQK